MVELVYQNLERLYLNTFVTPDFDQAASSSQRRTLGYLGVGVNADLNQQGDYRVYRLGIAGFSINGTTGAPTNVDYGIETFSIRAFLETETGLYTPVRNASPTHVTFSQDFKDLILPEPIKITRLQQSVIMATLPGQVLTEAQIRCNWFFDLERLP